MELERTSETKKPRTVLWSVGLTLSSSERAEIKGMAAREGRSDAGMIRQLIREAREARQYPITASSSAWSTKETK